MLGVGVEEFRGALAEVGETSRTFLPGVVDTVGIVGLEARVEWRHLDEQLPSGVYQQYDFASLRPAADPVVSVLSAELTKLAVEAASPHMGLDGLELNEADLHRYRTGQAGLGMHRDMGFYRLLVIGITLSGSGPIHVYDDQAQLVETWDTGPGDLYLFRAPGFAGVDDGRPRHATGPTSGRMSLTLRHNMHGFGGGWN